jgi:hypothetical protein
MRKRPSDRHHATQRLTHEMHRRGTQPYSSEYGV